MNYLIFDNDIYYETKDSSGIAPKDKIDASFLSPERDFSVAVIDSLQKKIAAPEKLDSKKDDIIASSFTGDYITQSEKIGRNLFQVTAIEKSKLSEIYKRLGFENVRLVVPYGVALREFLKSNNLFGQNKRIVFLDYMGNQVLLTIFNNELFTTPRRLSVATRRVVSEITRSQENYKALNKEEGEVKFLIATNSQEIMEEIVSTGLDSKENIVYFPEKYPALKGLRQGKFSMHYMLPEEFIRLRKLQTFKRRAASIGMMLAALGLVLLLFIGSFSVNRNALIQLKDLRLEEASLGEALKSAYRAKYKDMLRSKKKIDIPYYVGSFITALPSEYKVESIIIRGNSGGPYRFDAVVSCETKDNPIIGLTLPHLFRKARMENVLIKKCPGVRVVLDIH